MVSTSPELTELREGKASFLVSPGFNVKGPGKRSGGVFYNRQMEMNRDICISLLRAENRKLSILDAMTASGVRGIRMAIELDHQPDVIANDSSRTAAELAQQNVARLGLGNVTISNEKATVAMIDGSFDYIDIDPFGTPVWFIPQALMSVRTGGIVGITATDAAMLCGSAKGSERRYLCVSKRWPFMHELGVRNLLAYIVRMGASYDRAVYPVLSYFADHYFRLYFRVRNGVTRASSQLAKIGYALYDRGTGDRWVQKDHASGAAGPTWIGELHDPAVLNEMKAEEWFGSGRRMGRLLETWRGESEAPPLFYNMDELSARFGFSLPSLDRTIASVGKKFTACRTHFDPKGFKTDADVQAIREVLLSAKGGKGIS